MLMRKTGCRLSAPEINLIILNDGIDNLASMITASVTEWRKIFTKKVFHKIKML